MDESGPAFPGGRTRVTWDNQTLPRREFEGLTRRQWLAAHAPMPSEEDIDLIYSQARRASSISVDMLRKRRLEAQCQLRYEWADAMLATGAK